MAGKIDSGSAKPRGSRKVQRAKGQYQDENRSSFIQGNPPAPHPTQAYGNK